NEEVKATGVTRSAVDLWMWAVGVDPLEKVRDEYPREYQARYAAFKARSMPPWFETSAEFSEPRRRGEVEEPPLPPASARAASAPAPSAAEEPMDVERARAIQSFIAHGLRLDNLGGGLVIGGRVVTQEEIDLVAAMSAETLPEPDDSWSSLHREVKATNVEHPQTP
ncbi:MAG: hypothetical protein JWP05_1714, partial [Microbacteriaceae bacterium]|nr:hypothetical protein [Microbacteriaceae bacterium]